MQTFINYNILITGIFLLIFSQIVDASSNIQSKLLFKIIPLFLGLTTTFCAVKLFGWV